MRALKKHLTGTCLKRKILLKAGIKDELKPCPECGAEKNSTERRYGLKCMADHLGGRHSYMEMVMSEEARGRWEAIKKKHEKRNSGGRQPRRRNASYLDQ